MDFFWNKFGLSSYIEIGTDVRLQKLQGRRDNMGDLSGITKLFAMELRQRIGRICIDFDKVYKLYLDNIV